MGVLTGAQIELEIRSMIPEAKAERIASGQILRLINQAYQFDMAARWDIPELDATDSENCTAAQAHITFSATDVLRIKSVCTSDDGTPLTPTSANGFTRLTARSGDTTGVPTHFYRTGTTTSGQVKLALWPTPDAATALILNYSKRPTALTVTTATAIDTLFDDALIHFTAAKVAVYVGAFGSREKPDLVKGFTNYANSLMAGVVRPVRELILDSNSEERLNLYGESLTGAMK